VHFFGGRKISSFRHARHVHGPIADYGDAQIKAIASRTDMARKPKVALKICENPQNFRLRKFVKKLGRSGAAVAPIFGGRPEQPTTSG
jgi:hypothetical protein